MKANVEFYPLRWQEKMIARTITATIPLFVLDGFLTLAVLIGSKGAASPSAASSTVEIIANVVSSIAGFLSIALFVLWLSWITRAYRNTTVLAPQYKKRFPNVLMWIGLLLPPFFLIVPFLMLREILYEHKARGRGAMGYYYEHRLINMLWSVNVIEAVSLVLAMVLYIAAKSEASNPMPAYILFLISVIVGAFGAILLRRVIMLATDAQYAELEEEMEEEEVEMGE